MSTYQIQMYISIENALIYAATTNIGDLTMILNCHIIFARMGIGWAFKSVWKFSDCFALLFSIVRTE